MKVMNLLVIALSLLTSYAFAVTPDCGASRGTLLVGTNLPFPPYESVNASGVVVGFDADLACLIRELLGFTDVKFVNVTPFDFDSFVAGLAKGTFNIALAGLSITPARLAQAAAIKYSDNPLTLTYSTEQLNAFSPAQQAALRNPDTALSAINALEVETVAVQDGSFQQELLAQEPYEGITSLAVASPEAAVEALNDGRALAYFSDAGSTVVVTPGSGLESISGVVARGNDSLGLGLFLDSSCCQLYADIAAALASVPLKLAALRTKWNIGPFTPAVPPLTPVACASTVGRFIKRCPILQFVFDKNCPCNPTVVAPAA